MAADGTWNITIDTPMGSRKTTLELKASGDKLEGTQSEGSNKTSITEGRVDGDHVSWKIAIAEPMPMTLEFTGKVEGNEITGKADTGMFGSFPFNGTRSA